MFSSRYTLVKRKLFNDLLIIRSSLRNCSLKTGPAKKNVSSRLLGQPTYETHPHLLKENEITPLIQRWEFQERRQRVMDSIMSHMKDQAPNISSHIVVIPSATKQYMSNKIPYVFRQNTEFLYLTGCQEPDSCLVMTSNKPGDHKAILFMQENDLHKEIWDGPLTGPENAQTFFGVNQGLPLTELENYMSNYCKTFYLSSLWFDYLNPLQTIVHKVMCDYLGNLSNKTWESPRNFIHRQQVIKSPAEIALMQKSCKIASKAIEETIKFSRPDVNEHHLFAKVDYECRMGGAEFLAYPPVVAGGNRATIIHYIKNDNIINDGDLVLMDAGCEYHGYSSDITRTWPVNGKFSPEQQLLYEAVLDAQSNLIEKCRDLPTLDQLFNSMCLYLGRNLAEIGIIQDGTPQTVMKAAYEFCPHHVSHYLGMDVHDTSTIPRNIDLQPGMIITIEPGVYINKHHTHVPSQFRGIGIRIEDDILITDDREPVVLTKQCPKTVKDLEYFASKNL